MRYQKFWINNDHRYNPSDPLVSLHIPKTGGTAVYNAFKTWFGDHFHPHYFDEPTATMPKKIPFKGPVCIHGHFNKKRQFGVFDYYPEARQMIMILRDPFEIAVSNYFFAKKRIRKGVNFRDGKKSETLAPLRDYLVSHTPYLMHHIPFQIQPDTIENVLKKKFLYIGVQDDLQGSLNQLAAILGKKQIRIAIVNASKRELPFDRNSYEELRQHYHQSHPLEYGIYKFALDHYLNPIEKTSGSFQKNLMTNLKNLIAGK